MPPTLARITTDETLAADLRRSLEQRGVCTGRTWGDFKRAVEAFGVDDAAPLSMIEYGVSQLGAGRITAVDEGAGIEVREMSAGEYDRVR